MCELEPEVTARELPAEVEDLREQVAEEHRYLDAVLQPRIDAHIEALAAEVDRLIEAHRLIADETDIELRAETRWSAIWELSGRCLAICRVVLHDLRGGFTSEAVGTLRSLWEASILLAAVAYPEDDVEQEQEEGEQEQEGQEHGQEQEGQEHGQEQGKEQGHEELLRRWLAGEWVRPWQARKAVAKKEALAHQRMREAGVEPVGRGVAELGGEIYDMLSQPAHHRRGGFPETVSVELREFTYGPHPNAEIRAHNMDYASQLIETALIIVIDALADVIGREFARDALGPMQDRLNHVRENFQLPD